MECDVSYVGQTKRQLDRILEYENNIRRDTTNYSVITDHRLESNHEFNWNDVDILDRKPRFTHKCLISEIIYIKRQQNSIDFTDEHRKP